jgi:hypothetical protein
MFGVADGIIGLGRKVDSKKFGRLLPVVVVGKADMFRFQITGSG